MTTPITEADGRMADYLPDTNQLLIANQGGVSSSAGIKMNKTAFEPRIGLAWKVLGSDKTAIRAGYAVYHDSAWSMGAQGLWQNPPFFAESDGFGAAGCAFETSYCSAVLGQSANACEHVGRFSDFRGTSDAGDVQRNAVHPADRFPPRDGAAV